MNIDVFPVADAVAATSSNCAHVIAVMVLWVAAGLEKGAQLALTAVCLGKVSVFGLVSSRWRKWLAPLLCTLYRDKEVLWRTVWGRGLT